MRSRGRGRNGKVELGHGKWAEVQESVRTLLKRVVGMNGEGGKEGLQKWRELGDSLSVNDKALRYCREVVFNDKRPPPRPISFCHVVVGQCHEGNGTRPLHIFYLPLVDSFVQ